MSWMCTACHQVVPEGIGHACVGSPPLHMHPIYDPGRYTFTPIPLTADQIRQIVREELERAKQGS